MTPSDLTHYYVEVPPYVPQRRTGRVYRNLSTVGVWLRG